MRIVGGYRATRIGDCVEVVWDVEQPSGADALRWTVRALVDQDPELRPRVIRLSIEAPEGVSPSGGLQSRFIRGLTLTGALDKAKAYLKDQVALPKDQRPHAAVREVPITIVRDEVHRERGKRLRGEERRAALAFLAWTYQTAASVRRNPKKAVADLLGDGWTANKIKGQVAQAIKEGLFERTQQGAPGGRLTPAGELLVSSRLLALLPTESGILVTEVHDGAAGEASLQEFAVRFAEGADGSPPPEGIIADATGVKPSDFTKERSPGVRVMQR